MKKTLIAVAALAATAAFAQNATVYGRLDIGYANATSTSAAGVDTKNNGVSGDGMGLVTNLWGIKVSEDLGGGMKANVQLEQGLSPDTGATNTGGFNRISTVGLSGSFGSVNFGRYYTPLFQMAGASDVFGTTGATTVNKASADGVRSSDSIFYASNSMNGLQVKLSYGNNDKSVGTGTDKSGNLGASVGYANGPLMVGVAMGSNTTDTGSGDAKNEGTALSATYDFGAAKLYAGIINAKQTTAAGVETKQVEQNIGVSAPMGSGVTLMAGVGRNVNTDAAGVDTDGTDTVVGVKYDLSKRTSVYLKTGTYNKIGDAKDNSTVIGLATNF